MLAYGADENSIFARLVTSQTKVEFGRDGTSKSAGDEDACKIVSAAPLPTHEYNVVLGLDRKMRLFHSLDDIRLTNDEKDVMPKLQKFYESRPLPDDESPHD
ncbi:MAG: hypothetical protein ABIP15_02080 [Devosia sp.]